MIGLEMALWMWALAQMPVESMRVRHILLVGDSEAATACPYTNAVAKPFDEVSCSYRGGTSIDQWGRGRLAYALRAWRDQHHLLAPDVIVVFLGTNDVWRRPEQLPDLAAVRVALEDLPCVWVGPVAGGDHRHAFTKRLRAALEDRCTWVDSEDVPLWDHWHPAKRAAIEWLERVWRVLP